MSATARATSTRPSARPAASRATAPSSRSGARRPALREVPRPAPAVAGAGIFSLVVLGVLVGGAVLLLVLNTSLAQGAFELSELNKQQRELAVSEQTLLQEVAKAESPEALQRRAERLGMVPVASPVFLRLADGKVLGVPRAAQADPRRAPVTGGVARTAPSDAAATSATSASRSTAARSAAAAPASAAPAGDAAVADPLPVDDAAVPDGEQAGGQP